MRKYVGSSRSSHAAADKVELNGLSSARYSCGPRLGLATDVLSLRPQPRLPADRTNRSFGPSGTYEGP